MKIKLAILEKDQNYLNRIVNAFSTKYPDKFEIYSFTEQNIAMSMLDTSRIDILVASNAFEIDVNSLPKRCGFAYLVDSSDVETFNDRKAISKFQKVDLIYKQVLSIYSEISSIGPAIKLGDGNTFFALFTSPAGGDGASTMAAAAAMYFASKNKKTLYLNLEMIGSSDLFFSGEGQFDMSDIVFALKSKNTNLSMKLESCVKQDKCGVYFYSQSKVALDMLEINADDIIRLISELKIMGSYDYVILDVDFSLNKEAFKVLGCVDSVIWVGSGSEVSNTKIYRAYNAISIYEQKADAPITNKLRLVYNKFSNKTSKSIGEFGIKDIGGAPRYEHANVEQVLSELSQKDMFDKMI